MIIVIRSLSVLGVLSLVVPVLAQPVCSAETGSNCEFGTCDLGSGFIESSYDESSPFFPYDPGVSPGSFLFQVIDKQAGVKLIQRWSTTGNACNVRIEHAFVTVVPSARASYFGSLQYPCFNQSDSSGPFWFSNDSVAPSQDPFPSPITADLVYSPQLAGGATPRASVFGYVTPLFSDSAGVGVVNSGPLCTSGYQVDFMSEAVLGFCARNGCVGCGTEDESKLFKKITASAVGTCGVGIVRSYVIQPCGSPSSLTWRHELELTVEVAIVANGVQLGGPLFRNVVIAKSPSGARIHVSSFAGDGSVSVNGSGFVLSAPVDDIIAGVRRYSLSGTFEDVFSGSGTITLPDAPRATLIYPGDMDLDGDSTFADRASLAVAIEQGAGELGFAVLGDVDRNGVLDVADYGAFVAGHALVGCPCDLASGGSIGVADGNVDGDDFIAFFNAFGANSLVADISGGGDRPDGQVDGDDFIAFINGFAIGSCP